ncbi:MAG: CopG family transcriptional regulator [Bryobacteraceae bacterium]
MVRTQIQLTEEQSVLLRRVAAARRQSVAELIRVSVDLFMEREASIGQSALAERAKAAAGRFSSGSSDGSREHDRYLANAFGQR